MPPNVEIEFDMNRSGSEIARNYFQPPLSPALALAYRYVQDQDLWRWQYEPESKPFGVGLAHRRLELNYAVNPSIFEQLVALDPAALITEGRAQMAEDRRLMDHALASAFEIAPRGSDGTAFGRMLAVEIPSAMGGLRSQLGNDLAQLSMDRGLTAMGIVVYVERGMLEARAQAQTQGRENEATSDAVGGSAAAAQSLVKCSVRGLGDVDTTVISKAFGGGGHRLASSCIVERSVLESWRR